MEKCSFNIFATKLGYYSRFWSHKLWKFCQHQELLVRVCPKEFSTQSHLSREQMWFGLAPISERERNLRIVPGKKHKIHLIFSKRQCKYRRDFCDIINEINWREGKKVRRIKTSYCWVEKFEEKASKIQRKDSSKL